MPRISISPIPSVRTLVTGTRALFFFDALDHGPRIDDRTLRRTGETIDVTIDDVVAPYNAARVTDAAGVVRVRDADRTTRLLPIGDLRILRYRPRIAGSIRLRHRRHGITARPHGYEHFIDLLRRQIVDEIEVHLHARRAIAGRETLDLFVREQTIGRRLQVPDTELLAKVRHDIFGAVDRAREPPADLQYVLPHRPPVEQRVERDRAFDFSRSNLEHFRRRVHRLRAHEALMLLKQVRDRQQRRPPLLVSRNDLIAIRPQPL